MASVALTGAESPLQRSSPPSSPTAWERKGAGGMVRAALTPGPSPALRERGELVHGLGSVDRRRIAPATLISPFLAHSVGEEGGWGDGEGSTPPSSPTAWERKGAGGMVRDLLPLPRPQRGRGRGLGGW